MKPSTGWKSFLIVGGILGLLGTLPFLGFLLGDEMLFGSDQIGGYGNYLQFAKALRNGDLMGWNPWYLSGMPTLDALAGDLTYPVFWIVAVLFPTHKILGVMMWLHVVLAGFGAYLLLRRSFALDRWISTALAAAYMLNANFVSNIFPGHTAKVYVIALLPIGVHFLIRSLARDARFWHPLGLAAVTGLMVSTSHLQMSYYALVGYFVYWCWRSWEILREKEGLALLLRKAATFWAAVILGVGLALPVLYPPTQYVKHFSVRGTEEKTSFEHATSWSLHPEEVASLAVPEFTGLHDNYWGRNPFKLNTEYAGIAITVMGLAAAFALRSRWTWFWAVIAAIAVLNALGAHTPFYRLIYGFDIGGRHIGVPGIRNFRAAGMIMFWFAMAMTALSAMWLAALAEADRWKKDRREQWEKRMWIATGACGGTFLLMAMAASGVGDLWLSLFGGSPDLKPDAWANNIGAFRVGAFRTALLSAATLSLSALLVGGRIRLPGVAAGLLVICAIDLYPIDGKFIETFPKSRHYAPDMALASVQADTTTFRAYEFPGSVNNGYFMTQGIQSAGGFADNELAHMQEFRSKDGSRILAGLQQYPDFTVGGNPTLDLLNVKYLVFRPQQGAPLAVALNRTVLPRARLVASAKVAPLESQLNGVMDPSFDYRGSVLVLPEDSAAIASALGSSAIFAPPAAASPAVPADSARRPDSAAVAARPDSAAPAEVPATEIGTVAWRQSHPDDWTYQVTAAMPALLALSEPWYPHWKATIDGREVPILRIDYALRAIPVPAGTHEIRMTFHSPWVSLASKGALASALALLLWALGGWLVGRRRPSPVPAGQEGGKQPAAAATPR